MKIEVNSVSRFVSPLLLVLLAFTKTTDADLFDQEVISGHHWQATTLDFSSRNTANELLISLLFNVSGLLPDGFQVESVRIKNEGESGFNYRVKAIKTAGSDQLCDALVVRTMKDWQLIQTSSLNGLSLDLSLGQNDKNDLIFFISLEDSNSGLINQVCDFNLSFRSWRNSPDEVAGFFDEEILENHINSGVWLN